MPALVLDDPRQQVDQHGMLRLGDQAVVPIERGELVDRSPGHVEGDEVADQRRADQRADMAPVPLARELAPDGRDAGRARGERRVARDRLAVRRQAVPGLAQETAERLSVPELLVHPAREKGRHLGLDGGPGGQDVPQVDDCVGLDVHHVGETPGLARGDPSGASHRGLSGPVVV